MVRFHIVPALKVTKPIKVVKAKALVPKKIAAAIKKQEKILKK